MIFPAKVSTSTQLTLNQAESILSAFIQISLILVSQVIENPQHPLYYHYLHFASFGSITDHFE